MNCRSETSMNEEKVEKEKLLVERKHMCTICKKVFTLRSHLDRHLLCHSGDRPYQCTTCNKQFREKGHLNAHALIHSGSKPYQCSTCNKQFRQKPHLNRHLLIHSGSKPYECSTCKQRFSQKPHLIAHLTIHSGDKRFVCPTCSKQFRKRSDLQTHSLIHSGVKGFECPTCQKLFPHQVQLNGHLRIHSRKKPFVCPTCSQQFKKKIDFNNHKLIHSKKKPVTSESEQHLQQSSLLIDKSSLEERDLEIVGNKVTEYENKPFTSKTYFDEIVKTEIDADLEPNRSDFLFEVPIIKQELMSEEDLETPSCSYQTLDVKQEPIENADPSCLNLCDGSFIKEESELPTTI